MEVVDVEALGGEDGFDVRGHELGVEVRGDGEFCRQSSSVSNRFVNVIVQQVLKAGGHTVMSEIKEVGHLLGGSARVTRVRKASVGIAQLVEERMSHRLDGRQSLRRRVLEQPGDQIYRVGIRLTENLREKWDQSHALMGMEMERVLSVTVPIRLGTAYLAERVRLDLRELVLHVVGIHGPDLIPGRCSQNLDDLDKLVDARLAGEERLAQHELGHDAASRPHVCEIDQSARLSPENEQTKDDRGYRDVLWHTDFGSVVRSSEDELRSAVIPRTDVRDVGLVLDEDLGAAEVAQLEHVRVGVEKEVLRLDVSVADALGVDVGERAEELVDVQLDLEDGHGGLELVEMSRGAVDRLRHVLLHQVEVDFIFLRCHQRCLHTHGGVEFANPVTVGIVESLELDDVGMAHDAHDLKFAVLGERLQ